MTLETISALDDTQQFFAPPRASSKLLSHVIVRNPSASAACYLNVWDVGSVPSGTPTEAAADRVATIALAPGANTTIPIEHWFSAGVVLSATTANDATGDPGPDDLELTIAWANGG